MAEIHKVEPAVIDTGILYALSDKGDNWHARAVDFMTGFKGRLIVPSPVIPETAYLLNTYLGQAAEYAFIKALINRELIVEHFSHADLIRSSEIIERYNDANIGCVDALVVAIAERLKIDKILTTDRRHFSLIRPIHCKGFELLP